MKKTTAVSRNENEVKTIAVCAAQVPFFSGGAEAHVGGLVDQLRLRGYEVDLINIPYKWYPRRQLLNSIKLWESIDLTESNGKKIDLVIATKFPSYFIKHPRKVLWLIHQYRQMYDLMDTEFAAFDMRSWSDRRFRKRLVNMDTVALQSFEHRFTNAKNTAARLAKHNGLEAQALYHPPPLYGRYKTIESGDFLLSVGRLDNLKRVDAMIRTLPHLDPGVRCVVAGTGPARPALEDLAQDIGVNDRVDFRGFVADEDLIELYGRCAAVFFAPVDEDYGYITLEAFLSGKPVITAADSGGPLEFVEHGVNGLIIDCDNLEATGRDINELLRNKEKLMAMGAAGKASVSSISWDSVIDTLLQNN